MNMLSTIEPKSDQLNADDLIGSTMTITITKVEIPGGEQPVSVFFEGDNGKPYKPGKSMRRVMVLVWGDDAKSYVGHSMTLYRDDKVQFGGMAVGGIRISHMTGLKSERDMALTATRGNKKVFTVKPLVLAKQQPAAPASAAPAASAEQPAAPQRGFMDVVREKLDACSTEDEVSAVVALKRVKDALSKSPQDVLDSLNAEIGAAYKRVAPPSDDAATDPTPDDGWPGPDVAAQEGE